MHSGEVVTPESRSRIEHDPLLAQHQKINRMAMVLRAEHIPKNQT